jgi:hypothetical protein
MEAGVAAPPPKADAAPMGPHRQAGKKDAFGAAINLKTVKTRGRPKCLSMLGISTY